MRAFLLANMTRAQVEEVHAAVAKKKAESAAEAAKVEAERRAEQERAAAQARRTKSVEERIAAMSEAERAELEARAIKSLPPGLRSVSPSNVLRLEKIEELKRTIVSEELAQRPG